MKKKKEALKFERIEPDSACDRMAVSIFELPIMRSHLLRHIQRALANIVIISESVWTQKQAELVADIMEKMTELVKSMRES